MANEKKAEEIVANGQTKGLTGLLDLIEGKVGDLINLTIVTYVGEAYLAGTIQEPEVEFPPFDAKQKQSLPGDTFVTNINLVGSDITNVIPSKYADNESSIRAYHLKQVDSAMESMERRAELLMSMIKMVKHAIDNKTEPANSQ